MIILIIIQINLKCIIHCVYSFTISFFFKFKNIHIDFLIKKKNTKILQNVFESGIESLQLNYEIRIFEKIHKKR